MNRIITFIKYHNLFTIILGLILLLTASAFASEDVRNAVIGEKIEVLNGIDNNQILTVDLDNFDLNLQITNVSEDEENYYVDYTYQILVIKDNVWQLVLKEKTLTVSKEVLGNEDLGLYVTEELFEVADYEISYLKEVQEIEREKGQTKLVASVDYTGLIGLVLDIKNKVFPEYEPVITEEICDGIDNDRDGLIDEDLGQICCGTGACGICVDSCMDGVLQTCTPGTPATEICDGTDNNCNGQVDEGGVCKVVEEPPAEETPTEEPPTGQPQNFYYDSDKDGYGVSANFIIAQEPSEGYVLNVGDCNDNNPEVNPGATEICDGIDNNCNSLIDENLGQTTCGVGACQITIKNCVDGASQTCTPATSTEEICDGLDNDCDGEIDEEVCETATTTEPEATTTEATTTEATTTEPVCGPTEEICDGIDNDCDGLIDEDLTVYSGTDEGECQQGIMECIDGVVVETQAEIEPTDEICDGLDNNCDGAIDEDLGQTTCGIGACEVTIENCVEGVLQTCIPGIPTEEICDGIDNNCDGQIDEGGVCETLEPPEE